MSRSQASTAALSLLKAVRPRHAIALVSLTFAGTVLTAFDRPPPSSGFLQGTWTLQSAYEIQPDGKFAYPYGTKPKGILMADSQGRYVVEIYGDTRPKFPSPTPTPEQYKAAFLSMSVHTGTVQVDETTHILTFHVAQNANPDRSGTSQERRYKLDGDLLTYRVPAAAEGKVNTPVSIWKRVTPGADRPN